MRPTRNKPILAVVSPFIDKRHATERCLAEQIERLSDSFDIHIYSGRVEDLAPNAAVWHRVRMIPGPEILRFVWWVAANTAVRWWDRISGIKTSAVYTAGVNCFDADVISVHILFSDYVERARPDLEFRRNPPKHWARLAHRRAYYKLISILEKRIYRNPRAALTAISEKTRNDIYQYCRRAGPVDVAYYGINLKQFSREGASLQRASARRALHFEDRAFCVLLIGNALGKKGLPTLLQAASTARIGNLRIVVVTSENTNEYDTLIQDLKLSETVEFFPLRSDVEFYYSAADIYAGPSVEDAFALPVLEAMACGLPVITTVSAGVSEVVRHEENGFVLDDPHDVSSLANLLRELAASPELRQRIGAAAAQTAAEMSWDHNAARLKSLIDEITYVG